MKVTILFFSIFREKTGVNELSLELEKVGLTVSDALAKLFESYEGLKEWETKMLIAVNCEYASGSTVLRDGDELALMPPVQGG
ncbi:MAG: MoaD/ThiS family protein [Verrucomicrobiales bacterium]|nr:MoaD/ThiS family protein [Verrucomicrobiales bacterium]